MIKSIWFSTNKHARVLLFERVLLDDAFADAHLLPWMSTLAISLDWTLGRLSSWVPCNIINWSFLLYLLKFCKNRLISSMGPRPLSNLFFYSRIEYSGISFWFVLILIDSVYKVLNFNCKLITRTILIDALILKINIWFAFVHAFTVITVFFFNIFIQTRHRFCCILWLSEAQQIANRFWLALFVINLKLKHKMAYWEQLITILIVFLP